MSFSTVLKMRRKMLGLTLEEVGSAVGVARATVQRWESGEIGNPRRDKMVALASVLETDLETLICDSAPEENPPDRNAEIVIRMLRQMTPDETRKMKDVSLAVFSDTFDADGNRIQ